MADQIELADGKRLPLTSLAQRVPHQTFQTVRHAEIAERLASRVSLGSSEHAVYTNLLAKKSQRVRGLSALVMLAEAGILDVRAVRSHFVDPSFADLLPGLAIEWLEPHARDLVDWRQLRRQWVKVFAHRLYRVAGPWQRPAPHIIRAWVDTTDQLYPEEVGRARLLVYPFDKNPRRQWRYLRTCRKEGRNFALTGFPYRLGELFRLTFSNESSDVCLVRMETRAAHDHARELLGLGVELLSTTDEFEVATSVFHKDLEQGGVKSINTSHGTAVYGPYTHYSHFRFRNETQLSFYGQRGQFTGTSLRDVPRRTGEPRPRGDYAPVCVFLQGNWGRSGKVYEAGFEERALRATVAGARKAGIEVIVKPHPNIRSRDRRRTAKEFGVEVRPRVDGLTYPIFVNTLSSAFYDHADDGPVVFVADALFDPRASFGSGIRCRSLDELADEFDRFKDLRYWKFRMSDQRVVTEDVPLPSPTLQPKRGE